MGVLKLEKLLAWARKVFPQAKFEALSGWFVKYGHAGVAAAVLLCLVFGVVAAIKLAGWIFLAQGIGLAAMLVILQFTAEKFLHAGDTLIKASPSRLGSEAFLDCLALLAELAGILGFLSFFAQARNTDQWSLLWVGIGVWALADAVACIALHPAMTNVAVDPQVSAGEEAIGILSFLVKLVVRVVPIAFGVGAVIGAVGLLFGIGSVLRGGGLLGAHASVKLVAVCACLPFASYVLFAFYHLAIDLMRAILSLPDRGGPRQTR
jgi:hypothetical protein